MDSFWLEVIGILFLVILVAFFSASEVAVVSTRKSRMQELAEAGNRKAAVIVGFHRNPEQFLATVHVGMVFSLVFASGLAGVLGFAQLVPALEGSSSAWIREAADWISLAAIVIPLGVIVVVFGELVPKSIALRYAETIALRIASPMRLFATAFHFPGKALTFASNLVLRPLKDSTTFTESKISEGEFKLMLEEGTKSGVIDKTEHELIESVFEFTDTLAKEVMIPQPDVVAIDMVAPRDKIIKTVIEEGYSRVPVYRETIDNIVGIVYTKDLLGLLEYRDLIILQDVIRPAYFVPETMKISKLMREMQKQRVHIAVVIDEFGGTAGIITMEDIVEEIVGEIHDEYDEEVREIEQAADGSFLVNARMGIRDFNERFDADIPQNDEYESVAGFLHKLTGRIPELNEEIVHGCLAFTIVKKSQRRIRLVRFRKTAPAPQN